jgi:nicotinamide N-methyltransferase
MAAQHANLVGSIVHWLGQKPDSCALVVAGFHTGRSVVQDFFDVATGEDRDKHAPLSLAEIYEIDVDGGRREWQAERADETQAQAKRWVVVGVLKRRGGKMG